MVYVEDTNKVVFQGLDGYIASEKNGYILICQRSEEQRIKEYKGYDRVVRRTYAYDSILLPVRMNNKLYETII